MEDITVHSYSWTTGTDAETGYTTINCWALDRNSDSYLLRIHDFDAFCYVELPLMLNNSHVAWEGFREKLAYEAICNKLGDDRPHRYMFVKREKYYYYKGENKTYPMLLLCFHSIEAMNTCKRKLAFPFKIRGLKGGNEDTMVPVRVWETHIPIERKLLTLRNCKYSQWFNIKGIKIVGEDKISTLENEYVVDWKSLNPISLEDTVSWVTHPKVLSFDIETYSDRHNAMPDSLCSKHVVYLISVVFQKLMEPETRKREIILFGDCSETNIANLIKVKTEMELIDTLQNLILKYDPEITTGYNVFGYDFGFLENRLKRRLKEWKCLGRIKGEKSVMKTISWSSSAYKNQEFSILEMNGRINIDLLPVIKRDHKLPLYKLDFVANHFLGKGKYDVTPKQMFETYELQTCLSSKYVPGMPPEAFYNSHKKEKNIDGRSKPEDILEFKTFVQKQWAENHKTFALDEMRKVVDYCVVDSDLVIDLFDKLNVWIGLITISNIMGIVPEDIFTRGTGVRMTSQIYDEASKDGIVLDEVDFPQADFVGGYVADPQVGVHHNIIIVDFQSMYPKIQISHNMDHHSLVPDHLVDIIPDDQCHVIEWEEEIADEAESDEEEDENKEEVKKKVVKPPKIQKYKYKFKKEPMGIMPRLLSRLIDERNKIREKQKHVPKGSLDWNVLEQTQLGIKCSSNAFFGSCGSRFSKLRCPPISSSITAKARESTKKMNAYLEGLGHRIIYGDTDSSMVDVGVTDPKSAWEIGEKLADELSTLFLKPQRVEMEAIFSTMLCIKKKMYLCIYMDKNGNPIDDPDKMKIRGVTLARRDNCKFQREFYKPVCWKVMHKNPFMDTFNFIVDKCIQLASHSVPWQELTMIKGLGSHYKSASYMMAIFSREMEKSGNPIVAGDRIPYIVVKGENEQPGQKLGYKMRSQELFLERAVSDKPEHIDYLYYLERTVSNGIQKQLFQIGYKKELEELELYFSDIDQKRFFEALRNIICNMDRNPEMREIRIRGYDNKIVKLREQCENDSEVIESLREDEHFSKIVKPLYSYYIKRRKGRGRRLSSRVDKEPILMMVRIMRAKEEVMKSVRAYVPKIPKKVNTPEKRKLVLKIL
jgi:DNA polymerase delta subunit 1